MKIIVFKWDVIKEFPTSGNIHITNTIYDANYVNRHYKMISRLVEDLEYICITNDNKGLDKNIHSIPLWDIYKSLGGCYNRLFIFSKEAKNIIGDKFLHLDLDTTVLRDISYLYDSDKTVFYRSINPEQFKTNSKYRYHINVSLVIPGELDDLWLDFIPGDINKYRSLFTGTDQSWLNYYILKNNIEISYWDTTDGIHTALDILKDKKLPENCSMISWAGPRDPHEKKWKKQLPWLEEYL